MTKIIHRDESHLYQCGENAKLTFELQKGNGFESYQMVYSDRLELLRYCGKGDGVIRAQGTE